jgi:hypothetical protein
LSVESVVVVVVVVLALAVLGVVMATGLRN